MIIDSRRNTPVDVLEKNNDLLSRFLCLKDENGEQYSDVFLRDIVLNFAIAGRGLISLIHLCSIIIFNFLN